MRISKLLNKKSSSYFIVIFFLLIGNLFSNEPVDIWDLEDVSKKKIEIIETINKKKDKEKSIYDTQIEKIIQNEIQEDVNSNIQKIEIVGLYDPQEYDLTMNMWKNSNGKKIKKLYEKIIKLDLSIDAREITNIALLTN